MEEARRMPLRGHINADLPPKKSAYFSRTEPTRTWWSSLGCVVLMGTLRHFLSQLCLETRGPRLCLPSCEMGWMAIPFQCEAESQTSYKECKVVGSRGGRAERLLTDACRFPSPEEMSSSNCGSLISGLLLESFFLHQWNRKQGLGEGWFWLEDTACNPFWMFMVFVMTGVFLWQNSVRLCPASFCTPWLNLPVTPVISWLPTFAWKGHLFLVLILEGLVGHHRNTQLQLLQH